MITTKRKTPQELREHNERWYRHSRYRTRKARRLVVAAGAGAVGLVWASAVTCWYLAPSDTAMWTTFALSSVMLLVYAWVYTVLLAASHGTIGIAPDHLDERQRAEQRHVRTLAHRATAWMLFAATALTIAISKGQTFQAPAAALLMFMTALTLTHLILPHLIGGWRLPDPIDDDLSATT